MPPRTELTPALERALDLATPPIYPSPEGLRELVAGFAHIHLTLEEAMRLRGPEILEVLHWLRTPTSTRPSVLGRPHVLGEPADTCLDCGALLGGLAEAYGVERLTRGCLVGTDCGPAETSAKQPTKRRALPTSRRSRRRR